MKPLRCSMATPKHEVTAMKVYIFCEQVFSKADLHSLLKTTLDFPEHYGNNLDALHDCLTDLSKPVLLVLCDYMYLEERLGDYAASFLSLLEDTAAENPNFAYAFENKKALLSEN